MVILVALKQAILTITTALTNRTTKTVYGFQQNTVALAKPQPKQFTDFSKTPWRSLAKPHRMSAKDSCDLSRIACNAFLVGQKIICMDGIK